MFPKKSKFIKRSGPRSVIQKSSSLTIISNGRVSGAPMDLSNSKTAGSSVARNKLTPLVPERSVTKTLPSGPTARECIVLN